MNSTDKCPVVGDTYNRKFHREETLTVVAVGGNLVLVNETGFFHTTSWETFVKVYEVK